jgi:hypothetical protein
MAMGWQQPIKVSAVAISTARTAIAVANQTATWTDLRVNAIKFLNYKTQCVSRYFDVFCSRVARPIDRDDSDKWLKEAERMWRS